MSVNLNSVCVAGFTVLAGYALWKYGSKLVNFIPQHRPRLTQETNSAAHRAILENPILTQIDEDSGLAQRLAALPSSSSDSCNCVSSIGNSVISPDRPIEQTLILPTTVICKENLEKKLMSLIVQSFKLPFIESINSTCINPNETHPGDYIHILRQIRLSGLLKPGGILSVGSERTLFLLLLADESITSSLIALDRDPYIKAYLDALLCLIRLSENHPEFVSLAKSKDVDKVISKIYLNSTISKEMKEYYLKNIRRFAQVYFEAEKVWVNDPSFDCVNYWKNEHLFQKLKRYLDAGAIIALTRDLNDPLLPVRISIIDESNVCSGGHTAFLEYKLDQSVSRPDIIISTGLSGSSYNPNTLSHDLIWRYKWNPFTTNWSIPNETFSDNVSVNSIITAVRTGNLKSIQKLLVQDHFPLTEAIRGWAVAMVGYNDRTNVLNELLKNGPISPEDRGYSLIYNLVDGYPESANLLIDGSISQEDRGRSLIAAFTSAYSCYKYTMKILDSGPISSEDKFAALFSIIDWDFGYRAFIKETLIHHRLLTECKESLSKKQIRAFLKHCKEFTLFNTDEKFMSMVKALPTGH